MSKVEKKPQTGLLLYRNIGPLFDFKGMGEKEVENIAKKKAPI